MTTGLPRSATVAIKEERRADGTILLDNAVEIPSVEGTIPARLKHWAQQKPDATFLTQGDRLLTYGETERQRKDIAARLLGVGASPDHPLMLVADNGIDHALLVLAATSVAIPVAVVSPSYVVPAAAPWGKLHRVLSQIEPALVVTDNVPAVADAMSEYGDAPPLKPLMDLSWLDEYPAASADDVDAAEATVDLDTVAKLLFTSGSTAYPKAVPNTQRMMVSNMRALEVIWPFLLEQPPVSVDWLPWNHTFGGNCCFHTTLWFGGHSHIDAGRPVPALFGKSVEALKQWKPSLYYNVPAGFDLLASCLEDDPDFAVTFFGNVRFVFNAGAALPDAIRARLEKVALEAVGEKPNFVGGWGATETAPFSSVLYFEQPHAANLGLPLPGTTLKLVPNDDRYEVRVKGPNVMPRYWRDPDATTAAFDEEGFYRIGDAVRPADPEDLSRGLLFDGRVSENFKLQSGTWVNVGALRLAVISACEGLISDAVVAGEGRSELGLLVFPNEAGCRRLLGEEECATWDNAPLGTHPSVHARMVELLGAHNAREMGSSRQIKRFTVLTEPPNLAESEITDKGYLNQRRVLARRTEIVEEMYAREADF